MRLILSDGIAASGTKNNDVGHAGKDPTAIDPREKPENYYQQDGKFYQVDANGNPQEVSPAEAVGQRVWAVTEDRTAGWWTVDGNGDLDWAGATGERRYEEGQVWQIGTDGKDYAVQVSVQEEKNLEFVAGLVDNKEFIAASIFGRDASGRLINVTATGNDLRILSELGLKNKNKMNADEILDVAQKFLGKGYVDKGNGRYVSADGTRVFRMGDNDLLGKHAGGPHVNFEILIPNPDKPGKMMVGTDIHIYLKN